MWPVLALVGVAAVWLLAARMQSTAPSARVLANVSQPWARAALARQCATFGGVPVKGDVAKLWSNATTVYRGKGYAMQFSPHFADDCAAVGIDAGQIYTGATHRESDGSLTVEADPGRHFFAYYDVDADATVRLFDTGFAVAKHDASGYADRKADGGFDLGDDQRSRHLPDLLALVRKRVEVGDPRTCAAGAAALADAEDHGYVGGAVVVRSPEGGTVGGAMST